MSVYENMQMQKNFAYKFWICEAGCLEKKKHPYTIWAMVKLAATYHSLQMQRNYKLRLWI
jgi:hypothetical protein